MPIDVETPGSPGHWIQRLSRKLTRRQARLQELDDRMRGNPPLPEGAETMREAYRRFQAKARTNFAGRIVDSRLERMKPAGVRTGAAGDDNGDADAAKIWDDNGLDVEVVDTLELMLGLGDSYMITGPVDKTTGSPIITGEDPRQVVTIHDPARQRIVRAGLKVFHDPEQERDLAYLYLPGKLRVAYRPIRRTSNRYQVKFSPKAWEWDESLSADFPDPTFMPVTRFRRRRGVGVFEHHTDLLDRIDHMVLSRMVIAAMQAYRQRAAKNAPTHDEDGKEIDYEAIFVSDPGAIWALPEGIELWESGQVDLTPVLSAVAKDLEMLSAVAPIPLAQLTPSAMPQSAEGAQLAREGLVFAVEDDIARATEGLRDVMANAFLVKGDTDRSDRSKIEILWTPPERLSLAERADAVSKTTGVIPRRSMRSEVLQFPPKTVARMEVEDVQDALLAPPPEAPVAG